MIGSNDFASRVRSDGLEEKEFRLNMFHVPQQLPIGQERSCMSNAEYARRAGPALVERYHHEQAVQGLIAQQGQDIHKGERMAAVAFNQAPKGYAALARDNWGAERLRNVDPNAGKTSASGAAHRIFDDDHAGAMMDGRGDGGGYRVKGGNARGFARPDGRPLIPSSGILGADVRGTWAIDRDQRLDYASDPVVLAQAAALGAENAKVFEANKLHSRQSHVAFGDYDLNPGGHRQNANLARADDYGVDRLRSDAVGPGQGGRQVAQLLTDPDPYARPMPHSSPSKPFAGRSAHSNVQFSTDVKPDPPPAGPHAGRRSQSTVFNAGEGGGARAPPVPDGSYLSHDVGGVPKARFNPHGGRITESSPMRDAISYNPEGQAMANRRLHDRRRGNVPLARRAAPLVEDVVFDGHGPMSDQDVHAVVNKYAEPVNGKKPIEARAMHTNVGPRELGGAASAQHPDPPSSARPRGAARGGYADHPEAMTYVENADCVDRHPPPPPARPSAVAEMMNGGEVAPGAYSAEPRGLPRRHPGPERLTRGKGVDGLGHDHRGRQLATSLVDEVIFGRENFQGKQQYSNFSANFGIDATGNFAHR